MELTPELNSLVGKTLNKDIEEWVRARFCNVRYMKQGSIYTMDAVAWRLNIIVDDKNIITNVRFG